MNIRLIKVAFFKYEVNFAIWQNFNSLQVWKAIALLIYSHIITYTFLQVTFSEEVNIRHHTEFMDISPPPKKM